MDESWKKSFENLIQHTPLAQDIQTRLLLAIEKLSPQEQILLLQLFERYPEKIPAFWEVSRKKFEYTKNGIGDLDKILKEELELFA